MSCLAELLADPDLARDVVFVIATFVFLELLPVVAPRVLADAGGFDTLDGIWFAVLLVYKYIEGGQIQTLAVRNVNTSFNPIRGTLTKLAKGDLEIAIEIVCHLSSYIASTTL